MPVESNKVITYIYASVYKIVWLQVSLLWPLLLAAAPAIGCFLACLSTSYNLHSVVENLIISRIRGTSQCTQVEENPTNLTEFQCYQGEGNSTNLAEFQCTQGVQTDDISWDVYCNKVVALAVGNSRSANCGLSLNVQNCTSGQCGECCIEGSDTSFSRVSKLERKLSLQVPNAESDLIKRDLLFDYSNKTKLRKTQSAAVKPYPNMGSCGSIECGGSPCVPVPVHTFQPQMPRACFCMLCSRNRINLNRNCRISAASNPTMHNSRDNSQEHCCLCCERGNFTGDKCSAIKCSEASCMESTCSDAACSQSKCSESKYDDDKCSESEYLGAGCSAGNLFGPRFEHSEEQHHYSNVNIAEHFNCNSNFSTNMPSDYRTVGNGSSHQSPINHEFNCLNSCMECKFNTLHSTEVKNINPLLTSQKYSTLPTKLSSKSSGILFKNLKLLHSKENYLPFSDVLVSPNFSDSQSLSIENGHQINSYSLKKSPKTVKFALDETP